MATLWQKSKNGVWYITYRANGKQVARSLRTCSKRETVRLRREIEGLLAEQGTVSVRISEADDTEERNPTCDKFWTAFTEWTRVHRPSSAQKEYASWFTQLIEHTGSRRLGDVRRSSRSTRAPTASRHVHRRRSARVAMTAWPLAKPHERHLSSPTASKKPLSSPRHQREHTPAQVFTRVRGVALGFGGQFGSNLFR